MRVFQSSYRDRQGNRRLTKTWYAEIRDLSGTVRRLSGFRDKRATEELGRKLDRLVSLRLAGEQPEAMLTRWLGTLPDKLRRQLARIGLLDAASVASSRPLRAHLDDYKQALLDEDRTAAYVTKTVNRVAAILDGIGAIFVSDVSAAAVSRYLAERRAKGLSVKSTNHYLSAAKAFCNWLVRERRASDNPIAHVSALNPETDRRHKRRALETEELPRLLNVPRDGPDRHGMTGEDRYWLYRIALESGLRSGELRSLKRLSFDLDSLEPTVTIDAGDAKNRKAATLPLRMDTAQDIRGLLASKMPTAPVFCMPRPENVVVMLRGDLKAAGIPYRDETGRVVDFHAFRTTFATHLLRSGVDVRTAKDLMRHSTIAMTADVYACTLRGTQAEAVNRLPDLSTTATEAARATGTDDAESVLALRLARNRAEQLTGTQRGASNTPQPGDSQPLAATGTYGDLRRTGAHEKARREPCSKPPPRGIEPLLPA